MSFGFSVSDFLNLAQFAHSVYRSLKGAPAEFRALNLEVLTLSTTLHSLADEANSPHSIFRSVSPERLESFRLLLSHVSDGLRRLRFVVQSYPSLVKGERVRLKDRVGMATRGAGGQERGVREKLAVHIAGLNAVLTSFSAGALGRVEGLVRELIEKVDVDEERWKAQMFDGEDGWREMWDSVKRELKELKDAGVPLEEVMPQLLGWVSSMKRRVLRERSTQRIPQSVSGIPGSIHSGPGSPLGFNHNMNPKTVHYLEPAAPPSPRPPPPHMLAIMSHVPPRKSKPILETDPAIEEIESLMMKRSIRQEGQGGAKSRKQQKGKGVRHGGTSRTEPDVVDKLAKMFDHIFDIDDAAFLPSTKESRAFETTSRRRSRGH